MTPKPIASLSLDLDNLWSYLKIHGDPAWEQHPSYLSTFIPNILSFLDEHDLKITFFIVGKDAEQKENQSGLQSIVSRGHELGNHSFDHEPWMAEKDEEEAFQELQKADEVIKEATGSAPVGFRGPGFCFSQSIFNAIKKLGYQFDASILPTSIGPIARLYYVCQMKKLSDQEQKKRKALFGKLSNVILPNAPFKWETPYGNLLEIPVTTIPYLRFPFHLSYLIWLSRFSESLALSYLKFSIRLCKLSEISPSILLHPPDFFGKEEGSSLSFFPGMDVPGEKKRKFIHRVFNELQHHFQLVPMSEHAKQIGKEKVQTRTL